MKWISSSGGPLVLLPSPIQNRWSGAIRVSSEGGSDYDAACTVNGFVGTIERHGHSILVLNDEPLDTATVRMGPRHVLFARWSYGPSREIVEKELRHVALHPAAELERVPFTVSEPVYSLIDSAEAGPSATEYERIDLVPGDYMVRVFEFTPRTDTNVIICELRPASEEMT